MLPSGLPDLVGDSESLSRFLRQTNLFSREKGIAKAAAFLPDPAPDCRNTSVFRIGDEPELLRSTWTREAPGQPLRGVALFTADCVRRVGLDVIAEEPPLRHANLEGWPWKDSDAELQKAAQKECALQIASQTTLVLLD
jgi:hypothetical protein